ncbi:FadR/GntR family transcriptional regulator [Lihuaxuella thermophila]|uniref:GntR family transcriptional regulator, transcriptional repressor for pyruvate dehydrogenase complex n=1 Tax=Lihuaxuella thermophila TaxID=1173111 RepID=A0A1H8CQ34_9BACL|nr:FCD domain-containing protein [Lihuaxuella thermophila]SEM97086.1 GntR family transcriptional regulator, transcriptional repressor for pyruvate dehydrogenase complex [Lihuaxuella thermophila]
MTSEAGLSKFQSILKGIHQLIEQDELRPGDRLPSERELSERLQAGRSSVREVLRSLELLGLISTKRGEGTYLEPHHSHHLVDLLAGYILRDVKSRQDLLEVLVLLEAGAVRLAVRRAGPADIESLESWVNRMKELMEHGGNLAKAMKGFHEQIIRLADNYLLERIWHPVVQYSETLWTEEEIRDRQAKEKLLHWYRELVKSLKYKNEHQAVSVMETILEHFTLKRTDENHFVPFRCDESSR